MAAQIFVNLPVKDLNRSIEFFTKVGYTFNPDFTDENATCMIIGENIYAMLLVESYFKTFTGKEVADASKVTEVIVCVSEDSREEVDARVARAVAAGGQAPRDPQDHGFMYQHGYEDPDGHVWELVYMASGAVPEEVAAGVESR